MDRSDSHDSGHARRIVRETTAYYDRRAPWHDTYMSFTTLEAMESRLAPIVKVVATCVEGRDVLEIACGTGNWTLALSRRARSVTAIDSSPGSLEIAGTKLAETDNVTLLCADAYNLPESLGRFDAAFASDWVSHVPGSLLPAFMNGLHQHLEPVSRVIFVDMTSRPELEVDFAGLDIEGNRRSRRRLPDGTVFEILKNYPSPDELTRLVGASATDVAYLEFPELHRWLLRYRLK